MKPSTNNDSFTVQVASTLDDVEKMRSAWAEMNWHPNSDIDRFLTVVNHRSEVIRPHVIAVLKDGQTKLIVVGRIEHSALELKLGYKTVWKPRLRTLLVVYGGILGESDDPATTHRAMMEIIDMLSSGVIELVEFSHQETDSLIYHLAKEMPRNICRDNISSPNIHWRIALPDTSDAYFNSLKQKTRKNLRRALRHLEAKFPDKAVIKCFQNIDDAASFIMDADKIAKKTYQHAFGGGFADYVVNKYLIDLAAKRNGLLAVILYIDGEPVAYDWGTLYGKTFYWHAGGYDPDYSEIEPGQTCSFILSRSFLNVT